MKIGRYFRIVTPIPFLFFLYADSFASAQQSSRQLLNQHEVTVTLKLVQVYVTDKKGSPITDLEQSDFQILDNRKPVEITEFEKHILLLPGENVRVEVTAEPAGAGEGRPQLNRKFILFFDFAFNDLQGILKAKRAALNFINTKLRPTDEVAVLSFSALKCLTLHEYFTTEHQRARTVIEHFGAEEVLGRAERLARDEWQERPDEGIAEQLAKLRAADEDTYKNQVKIFSSEISNLAKALRYIPGVKHVVFFSGGVINPVLYGYGSPHSNNVGGVIMSRAESADPLRDTSSVLRDIYESMCGDLASSNSLIYAVNTQGEGVSHFKTPDDMGDVSLRHLAKLTGGIYFNDVANYEKIAEKIQGTTSSFYVLGYYVNEKWDGKYHKLETRVRRPGSHIVGQAGYFNPKPFSEYTEVEKSLQLIDLALSERPLLQEPLHFPMIALPFSTKGRPNLAVIVKIPGEWIKSIFNARTEIFTLVFDDKDNLLQILKRKPSRFYIPKDQAYFYSLLSVSTGNYNCRVVIRDLYTGRGARASSSISIPESGLNGLMIFPPLLLIPQENSEYLRGSGEKKEENRVTLSDVYPFDLKQYAPVLGEVDRRTRNILAVVRCFIRSVPHPDIQFSANFKNLNSGENIPALVSILKCIKEQSDQVFLIEISTGEFPAGKYWLNLSAAEVFSKSKVQFGQSLIFK